MKEITDDQIRQIAHDMGLGIFVEISERYPTSFIWFDADLREFARAVIKAHIEENQT